MNLGHQRVLVGQRDLRQAKTGQVGVARLQHPRSQRDLPAVGAELAAGDTLVKGSVHWTGLNDPEWEAGPNGSLMVGYLRMDVRLRYRYVHDGKTLSYDDEIHVSTADVTGDLSKKKIAISFGG